MVRKSLALALTVEVLYYRYGSLQTCAAPAPCPVTLVAGSERSERYCRCRSFLLTVCGLPPLPQVLRTADAVNNMLEMMPPLCREDGVCAWSARSTRGRLALASDTSE